MKIVMVILGILVLSGCTSNDVRYTGAELSARGTFEVCDESTASMQSSTSVTNVEGKTITSTFSTDCGVE